MLVLFVCFSVFLCVFLCCSAVDFSVNAEDLTDPGLFLVGGHCGFLRRSGGDDRTPLFFDRPGQPFSVEVNSLPCQIDSSGVERQAAFREGDAGQSYESFAVAFSDGFIHEEGGVVETICFGCGGVGQFGKVVALLEGFGVILQAMLLLLPVDEARVGRFPFEVDAEAVSDLNDGVFGSPGGGEACSPLPVFQRTQFKLGDGPDMAVASDVGLAHGNIYFVLHRR